MPKHYVTFGQAHTHNINGTTFDKDCVARFWAPDAETGRKTAFELFGPKFCFEYTEAAFPFDSLRYYPRGIIEVEL